MKQITLRQWNCLCCAEPIEKDLICCFLATGSPTQFTSSSPRSPPPPWHAPWGLCKPLMLLMLAVRRCDAASSWGSRGWGWLATFAPHNTSSLWLYLHRQPVRPLPKGICSRHLEEVCRVGTALDMGLHMPANKSQPINPIQTIPIQKIKGFVNTGHSTFWYTSWFKSDST